MTFIKRPTARSLRYFFPAAALAAILLGGPLLASAATTFTTTAMTSDGDLTIRGNVALKDAVAAADAIDIGDASDTVTILGDISLTDGQWNITAAGAAAFATAAIGTTTPLGKLRVLDGAVLFDGNTGDTPTSGEGTRFMWIPAKAAIRAGEVDGAQWDDANIGYGSVGFGSLTTASGLYSTAFGNDTTAGGQRSTAFGYNTTASGAQSTAFGYNTTASGNTSTAFGYSTTASGAQSTAFGASTTASGAQSTAFGLYTTASGAYSIAAGQSVTAGPAANTIALGLGASEASRLINNTANSLMVGFNSASPTLTVRGLETSGSPTLFKITGQAHTTLAASVEAFDVDFALNRSVQFTGSATPGAANIVTQRAILFQAPTYAFSNTGAQTITNAATLAIADAPIAGTNAAITNRYALWVQSGSARVQNGAVLFDGTTGATPASGAGTRFMWVPAKGAIRAGVVSGTQWDDANIGFYSAAFGSYTTAGGLYSAAFGLSTTASGDRSVALGGYTIASGQNSAAFGSYTIASGDRSVAFGDSTVASGTASFAAGQSVTAGTAANTIALGRGLGVGNELVNNTANSLMVGFNSTTPTLTVRGKETSGSPTLFKITGQAHTTLAASAEAPDVDIDLNRTVQWSTGALATQRAMVVRAPTYAFVGASTITDAATLAIAGAPAAGANATITNPYALWVQAGNSRFDGNVSIGSGGTAISKHLSVTAGSVVTASVANNACANYATVTVTDATVWDTAIATPLAAAGGIETVNLTWSAFVSSPNTVTIRACNPTSGPIDTDNTQTWRVDVWQH